MIEKISREKLIHKRLERHHGLYSCAPKSTSLEEIFVNIFDQDLGFGQYVNGFVFDWEPESHKVGADITVPSLSTPKISIKTGKPSKIGKKTISADMRADHRIEFSSFRLSAHPNMEAIQSFLGVKHQDITFLLSPHKNKRSYIWTVLENLDFSCMNWVDKFTKKGVHSGWTTQDENQGLIEARIEKGTSSQLWMKMRLSSNRIIHLEEICD